jgi:hypothetical protein
MAFKTAKQMKVTRGTKKVPGKDGEIREVPTNVILAAGEYVPEAEVWRNTDMLVRRGFLQWVEGGYPEGMVVPTVSAGRVADVKITKPEAAEAAVQPSPDLGDEPASQPEPEGEPPEEAAVEPKSGKSRKGRGGR